MDENKEINEQVKEEKVQENNKEESKQIEQKTPSATDNAPVSLLAEDKALPIVAIVFGGIAFVMALIHNATAAVGGLLALLVLVMGIIALILNRKKKKTLSLISIFIAVVAFFIGLINTPTTSHHEAAETAPSTEVVKPSESTEESTEESSSEPTQSVLDTMNQLAAQSKSTDEIYVTGKMEVGQDNALKPGIYDLSITGGSGNIQGDRKSINGMNINWLGGAPGSQDYYHYPSTIRIILLEGDTLDFSNISKVKFTAVPEKVTPTNKLGVGNYVVGRDIPAGTYKLSTNVALDPQFNNLGWDIAIYNDDDGDERESSLNPGNTDVAVTLKDGEIITTSFNASGDNANPELIFNPVK